MNDEQKDMEAPSLLQVNIDDAQDMTTLPAGEEVELRIKAATIEPSKKNIGGYNLHLTLEDPSEDTVKDIHNYMPIPDLALRNEDSKKYNMALLRWRDFGKAFNVSVSNVDVRELIGATGYAIVGVESDPEYGEKNTIKRFIVPGN